MALRLVRKPATDKSTITTIAIVWMLKEVLSNVSSTDFSSQERMSFTCEVKNRIEVAMFLLHNNVVGARWLMMLSRLPLDQLFIFTNDGSSICRLILVIVVTKIHRFQHYLAIDRLRSYNVKLRIHSVENM